MTLNLQAMPQLVPLREFIVSPGFAGAAAVIAAVIVLCAVLYASRRASGQRERQHQQAREDEQCAVAIQRCWDRLKWLVETAGIEPATSEGASLGLGPELALELLRGLLRDAEQLGDDALANAVTVYQHQFSLVLAQQGGPLSELAAPASSSGDGTSTKHAASSPGPRPDKQPATSTDETPSATAEVAASGRRHRQ
jgi:hypothetical protein